MHNNNNNNNNNNNDNNNNNNLIYVAQIPYVYAQMRLTIFLVRIDKDNTNRER